MRGALRTLRTLRMMRTLGALFLLMIYAAAQAQWVIVPRGIAMAGATIEVDGLQTNETAQPLAVRLPERLDVQLRDAQSAVDFEMERITPAPALDAVLKPNEFVRATYRLLVPLEMRGPVELTLRDSPTARATVVAVSPAPALDAQQPDRNVARAVASLSAHEPMYFIFGRRENTSGKIQLSLKYRLLDEDTWLGEKVPLLSKIHLGYTQTSIWDIGRESAPFRDTSYRPSVFYFDPNIWTSTTGRWTMSFSSGLEHESNGKDGANSRSLNTAFVRPRLRLNLANDYFVRFEPKVYGYLERGDNADIPRYRGYGDYAIGVGRSDDWLVNSTFRVGTGRHLSTQIDGTWRIRQRIFANASGFLHAQYFNGYGESLLDYNLKRSAQFRIGFGIVR